MVFICSAIVTAENGISSWARFFASLRCAQNDKLLYVLVNKRIMTIDAIESVSLSNLNLAFHAGPQLIGRSTCILQLSPGADEIPFLLDGAHVLTHPGDGLGGRVQGASENLLYLGINA